MPSKIPPPSKLSLIRDAMASGRERDALKIAAAFPQLGDEKAAITRAWAALQNPAFYEGIGQDPAALVCTGIAAIRCKWQIV
jgi:hypothetical protein